MDEEDQVPPHELQLFLAPPFVGWEERAQITGEWYMYMLFIETPGD